VQDAGAWQRTVQAESSARIALTNLLADYYGVAVDIAWLEGQGVDVSALVATGGGAVDAADGSSAGVASGAGSSGRSDAHLQPQNQAAVATGIQQEFGDRAVGNARTDRYGGGAANGSDGGVRGAQAGEQMQEQDRRSGKQRGVLGFLGL
jgi:hypothetical protein